MNKLYLPVLLLLGSSCMAAPTTTQTFIQQMQYANGKLLLAMAMPGEGKPACASNATWDYALPVTAKNQALVRHLVQYRSTSLLYKGEGSCTGDVETLRSVEETE